MALTATGRAARRSSTRGGLRGRLSCRADAAASGKTAVVVGGTGRVGAAAAARLADAGARVVLAGRSAEAAAEAKARHASLKDATFVAVDLDDQHSLEKALEGAHVVVHSAGPFQRREGCAVLEAALQQKVPYVDVCDDADYAKRAKAMSAKAAAAGVPCITSAGIYPGVSNLMAAQMVSQALEAAQESGTECEVERVLYSYFTAGSGGVGDTILATSFLLCGEPVTVWENGEELTLEPASARKVVDFGDGVGKREVFLYNLPEVMSTRQTLGPHTVNARFGTSPGIWNGAMVAIAKLVPKSVLENQSATRALAAVSMPAVRAIDAIVGEKVAMRVDVELSNGQKATGLFVHPMLSESVGTCTAAFALALLRGDAQPGVWYPEEPEAVADRAALLEYAATGCTKFELNKAPWMIETKPINLGFGLYWT